MDTSKQVKKFTEIKGNKLDELLDVLEENKEKYVRLYLSALIVYENTLGPIQVCNIQVQGVDLENKRISHIYNAKNKTYRGIGISDKVVELIEIIYLNTTKAGFTLLPEGYLIGGYNRIKQGKPYTSKDLRVRSTDYFKLEYPQFKDLLIYNFKHTTISNQFDDATVAPDTIRQRANHSKITTTQVYNRDKDITTPYEYKSKSKNK